MISQKLKNLRLLGTIKCQQAGQHRKMDTFLETHNLPKANHKDTENLKRPLTRTETEYQKPPDKEKAQDQITSKVKSIEHLRRFKKN